MKKIPKHSKKYINSEYSEIDSQTNPSVVGFIIIAILVCISIIVICCIRTYMSKPEQKFAEADNPNTRFSIYDSSIKTYVFFDRKAAVYYLLVEKDGSIAITPLYNIDGLPLCVDDMNHGDMEFGLEEIHKNLTTEP